MERKKEARKLDRLRRREEKRLLTEQRKREKEVKRTPKRCRKPRSKEKVCQGAITVVDKLAELQLSSSSESDDAICPKCGVAYADCGGLWVCCDDCNNWYDIECTSIKDSILPDKYFCEECTL